jgi:hypothetical protein
VASPEEFGISVSVEVLEDVRDNTGPAPKGRAFSYVVGRVDQFDGSDSKSCGRLSLLVNIEIRINTKQGSPEM